MFWLYLYSPNFQDCYITAHCFGRNFFKALTWFNNYQFHSSPAYWEINSFREYGFKIDRESISISWGTQFKDPKHSSRLTWMFPWQEVLVSHWLLYPSGKYCKPHSIANLLFQPQITYKIRNNKGEEYLMTANLEEQNWGCRWRWLRCFCKPRRSRYVWIAYVSDNNARARACKGTIDLLPGESMVAAIERSLLPGESIVSFEIQLGAEAGDVSIGH
jgi:hypothetical protein